MRWLGKDGQSISVRPLFRPSVRERKHRGGKRGASDDVISTDTLLSTPLSPISFSALRSSRKMQKEDFGRFLGRDVKRPESAHFL
jgi:hypothetical protein